MKSLAAVLLTALVVTPSAAVYRLERHAQTRALYFAQIISPGFSHGIRTVLESKSTMPYSDAVAYTTKHEAAATNEEAAFESALVHFGFEKPRGYCTLHFTREYIGDDEAIAHETCHCVLDWRELGERLYKSEVTKEQAEWYEVRASKCAEDAREEAERREWRRRRGE